jgi:hypothetical protein
MRRLLVRSAAVWLTCQLFVVGLSPFAVSSAVDVSATACTCGHGLGAACPMHHKPAARTTICGMQSATDHATLSTPFGMSIVGFVPCAASIIDDAVFARMAVSDPSIATARPVAPDPPPPRV